MAEHVMYWELPVWIRCLYKIFVPMRSGGMDESMKISPEK